MRDLTEKKLVFKPWFGCIGTFTVFYGDRSSQKNERKF